MARYSIKDMEHFSGIKAHTIRIWEKRYSLFDPIRTDTNIRLYTDNDVRKILNVAMLTKNGYKISNIASLDNEKIQTEVVRLTKNVDDSEKSIDQLLFHAVNLDTAGFEQVMESLIQEKGMRKTMEQIIFPFFKRIGVLWQVGSLFVAHEHFVSNLVRRKLISETSRFEEQSGARSILLFLPEGEWHELGLLYYNFLAAQAGLRCVYLGQSMPLADLKNVLTAGSFDFLCTAFVNFAEKDELETYLVQLSELAGSGRLLIFGRQLSAVKIRIPANTLIVKNSNDFLKAIQ